MLPIEKAMPVTMAPKNIWLDTALEAVGTALSQLYTVGDAAYPRKPKLNPIAENIKSAASLPIASTFLCESR